MELNRKHTAKERKVFHVESWCVKKGSVAEQVGKVDTEKGSA